MKPAPFRYHRPETRAEALTLLAKLDGAKVLAGGQSLVPMLNLRYVMVDDIIDINRIDDLTGINPTSDKLTVGAMTRQHTLLADTTLRERAPIFAAALENVGHIQTRSRGTVGGSLAHMDPAAELMALATLFDATVTVESAARGTREIAISEFPTFYMTPDIQPDELLTSVSFKLPRSDHLWGFQEFAQRHGDFAIVGAAAVLECDAAQRIESSRLVIFGVGSAPVRLAAAEELIAGKVPDAAVIRRAAETTGGLEFTGDGLVSADYRKRLARVLVARALEQAVAREERNAA